MARPREGQIRGGSALARPEVTLPDDVGDHSVKGLTGSSLSRHYVEGSLQDQGQGIGLGEHAFPALGRADCGLKGVSTSSRGGAGL